MSGDSLDEYMRMKASADRDQMMAGIVHLASLLSGYMRELVAQGFERHEALMIVIAFQQATMPKPKDRP